jgi:hypothetical protein
MTRIPEQNPDQDPVAAGINHALMAVGSWLDKREGIEAGRARS